MEKIFQPDSKKVTPALSMADGVDYVPMPGWKIFMIQFLNIAGTGPVFGAVLGAIYGPASFLWITFGCIFIGSVHDYFGGMLSIRYGGESLPETIGRFLGVTTKNIMTIFTVLLMLLVGAVFVYSPALILGNITMNVGGLGKDTWGLIWVGVILAYYIIATLIPIDKIIGRIYPVFAFAILFMAISLFYCLISKWPTGIPEIWNGIASMNPNGDNILPGMCITIACGAISGFHATQSPMMARCMKSETLGRPIFFGSMISEGIVAMIWAAVSSYFFHGGGIAEFSAEGVTEAPQVVAVVSEGWLGVFGGILAMLGVVFAPITTGDTALRGARLIVSDILRISQKSIVKRLLIAVPIFIIVGVMLWYNITHQEGFGLIWRYFGWANQTLAVFTLWAITVFLYRYRKGLRFLYTLIPAAFMTTICSTFIATAKIGLNISNDFIPYIGNGVFILAIVLFTIYAIKTKREDDKL